MSKSFKINQKIWFLMYIKFSDVARIFLVGKDLRQFLKEKGSAIDNFHRQFQHFHLTAYGFSIMKN